MIQVKELRVGNYVMLNNDIRAENGYNHEITEVRQLDCQVRLLNLDYTFGQFYKFIEPIPLTEEWLVKFGFGIHEFDNTFVNNIALEQAVMFYDTKYKLFTLETERGDEIQIPCEHVHQLQNLYHALTGEELTIKE